MYLPKIEECFFKNRRQGTILSPQNWLVAEKWENMGIPIHIVCKGIEKACKKFRSTHKEGYERIDILIYCEPEILRLWKEFKRVNLGAHETKIKNDKNKSDNCLQLKSVLIKRIKLIREFITGMLENRNNYIDLINMALSKINWSNELDSIEKEEINKDDNPDIDIIERRLNQLDNAFIKELLSVIPDMLKDELYQTTNNELSAYKKQMNKEVYDQTFELARENKLREIMKLRKISLYST